MLDWAYIDHWALRIGVKSEWQRVQALCKRQPPSV